NEMQMEAIEINVPDAWNIVQSKSSKTHAVGYRFYPNLVKGEGFFITVFKKNAATNSSKYKESKLVKPVKAELEQLQSFYPMPNGFTSFKQNEAIRIFPECFCAILQQLAAVLYIKKAGIEMGIVKTNSFIPAHELAVSILDKTNLPYIELNKEQAVQYLQRKELHLEGSNGWCLLKLEGTCLGWVKKLPNRINNYYPAEWRILKT
ncbi:MAG: RNA methyltransferase, partial [Sediminibacterium sp.]|nr:RNA methyltransferase [Sediminibacterium sp.]